ncbi:transcriptional regulator MraZ [Parashewanella curva]|uniref:Transcriptional regulator MraZ n=1 Tax=Parashewanella curva TaxID=2338552 RepID=A0A3L8PU59_9GAMM|nr:division/cell wall cluster transcriptional repressor MraZ [Parashewanella curva]RLV58955.1 transcriptional regulator MraZ [Parashewanella curva]
MFSGASSVNLDSKGRIAMPTRYRELLRVESEGKFVITVDIQSTCLLLYPIHEWHKIEAKLLLLSDTQQTERALKRLLLGHAHECEMDGNGRLLLPQTLRKYAGLEKHAMLVGQLNKFELWDESAWQQLIDESKQAITNENLASSERLSDFSL